VRRSTWPAARLPVAVLVVSAAIAASVVLASSSRSRLADARRDLDIAWNDLRPALDQRYQALTEAATAIRNRLGTDRALLAGIERAVSAWPPGGTGVSPEMAAGRTVEDQVRAAVRLEGLAARLTVMVAATPRLRSSDDVARALDVFDRTDPEIPRQQYNRAAGAYEEARGGFPRRLVAAALGFDASRTLEVPA